MRIFSNYYDNLEPEIREYFKIISPTFPNFLIPFIETDTMQRLAQIGYFCGMDYASKEVYNFKYYLNRLDHSISTALMVWHHTYDVKQTIIALFHDAGSPAFSHVIDYMNDDYVAMESTEEHLASVLSRDTKLIALLKNAGLKISDLVNYKDYSLVDNKRPKMCADRLDGIFLTSLVWTQETDLKEIEALYEDIIVVNNEDEKPEFSTLDVLTADRLVELNDHINAKTHEDEDFYLMSLLSAMVKYLIDHQVIDYVDLYILNDQEGWALILSEAQKNEELAEMHDIFTNLESAKINNKPAIKDRKIDPLILELRYSTWWSKI